MSSQPYPDNALERTEKPASSRILSVDALRGFDMFWIMGADLIFQALGKVSRAPAAQFLAGQLDHKPWAGFGFYDGIFPLFLFIVGISLVFSLGKMLERHGRAGAVKRILLRSAALYALGLIYNGGLSESWPNIRLVGVLQRIAVCYAAAGLLFCTFKPRVLLTVFVVLLVGYWGAMRYIPIRDIQLERHALEARLGPSAMNPPTTGTIEDTQFALPNDAKVREAFFATTDRVSGHFESGYNLANQVDYEFMPGRMYNYYWDPEGYVSTFPSVATCLLGVFAGLFLQKPNVPGRRKALTLLISGVTLFALGQLWGIEFPVVKRIWTSSFVLVAGGWSLFLLSIFYYVVDVLKWQRWCQPFVWIGMNPITLYMMSALVDFVAVAKHFVGGNVQAFMDSAVTPGFGDMVIALFALAVPVTTAWFLYSRKIFLRV